MDADIKKLVAEMFELISKNNGIGLSAPQIGVLKRVIIAEYDNDHAHSAAHNKAGKENHVPRTVLINPKIIWMSKKEVLDEEGCLSFPNIYGMVRRPERIRCQALDEKGKPIKFKASGLLARVIQHEVDHLDGVLFVDKLEGDPYTYEVQSTEIRE